MDSSFTAPSQDCSRRVSGEPLSKPAPELRGSGPSGESEERLQLIKRMMINEAGDETQLCHELNKTLFCWFFLFVCFFIGLES